MKNKILIVDDEVRIRKIVRDFLQKENYEILEAEEDNLEMYYPDIAAFKGQCYYDDCRHLKEPDCAVRAAVQAGKIHKLRYESYVANMEEIKTRRKY